jgi:plasmid stabilization system protein ParE
LENTRELVASPAPYVVVYRLKIETVEVVRIDHPAQDWPHRLSRTAYTS